MTDDARRARIRSKAQTRDYELKHNGTVIRRKSTYYTIGEWEEHLAEQRRRLELQLKAATTIAERSRIRDEIQANEIMQKFTKADK
ncbi:MAG: hypothetical protein IKQ69_07885 [Oscillospiraceae bacterium]|nr:hypothetical protein [Oscillospiraceae bacterium]